MDPVLIALLAAQLGLVGRSGERLDANETAFLTRNLEHVRTQVYEVRYANLLARGFMPTATDIPAWASHVIEVIYDATGRAKIVAPSATDLPRADVVASEQSYKVVNVGAAYGFSLQEMMQAAGTNTPLSPMKAKVTRRMLATAVDELLFNGTLSGVGQTITGMVGIANNASVPILTSAQTGSSWTGGDVDAILKDLNQLRASVSQTTLQMFEITDILLAPREYDIITQTRTSTLIQDSILTTWLKNNPGIAVSKWHRLTNAGAGGNTNRCIAFQKSAEVLEAVVPLEFQQLAPQVQGFETVIPCWERCGGVRWHMPSAAAYLDLDATP